MYESKLKFLKTKKKEMGLDIIHEKERDLNEFLESLRLKRNDLLKELEGATKKTHYLISDPLVVFIKKKSAQKINIFNWKFLMNEKKSAVLKIASEKKMIASRIN